MIASGGLLDRAGLEEEIRRCFESWEPSEGSIELPSYPPLVLTPRRVELAPEDRAQVNLYLGHLGVRRTDPRFATLLVMDHVLGTGAGFTDRLSRRLRDELGLAYSVYATITATAGREPAAGDGLSWG